MRLDLRKLRFRQPKLVATHLCLLFGSRESRHYARANTFMGPDPSQRGRELNSCSGSGGGVAPVSWEKSYVDPAHAVQIGPCCRIRCWADKRVLRGAHEVWSDD